MSAAAYQAVNLSPVPGSAAVAVARRVLRTESEALSALAEALDGTFERFIEQLAAARGRVVVTGMGKSGHIGRKIAATLASTGTPALYVHPAEASHGDLGMLTAQDVVLALSNSGETPELADIVAYSRRFAIPLLAIVGRKPSSLAETADLALVLPKRPEACPMGLAPTTSTTSMLALGDALAVALLERRGFGSQDFGLLHPGGKLGRRLVRVDQLMHSGSELPLVGLEARMSEVLLEMTAKRLGCVGVLNGRGGLAGIITDGDLRRHMSPALLERPAVEVMTPGPRTIRPQALAAEALAVMNQSERPFTVIFVVENGRPVGALHMHDCLRAGVA
ncbi:MAG TPA: KpsF/GutQ family sugar-phosphate isomerase [Geminicoccaceae bacterium]|jgi:arabinose-5-phosphate isomerase|nr:KpsF/GutQ family sugar-phosphate isomerase [Geminicoccaceae bacterium]